MLFSSFFQTRVDGQICLITKNGIFLSHLLAVWQVTSQKPSLFRVPPELYVQNDLFLFVLSLTSSISVAEIREPPHISQANTVAYAGEQKLIFTTPLFSGGVSSWSWGRRWRLMFSLWHGLGPVLMCWTLMMSFKAYDQILSLYNWSYCTKDPKIKSELCI